MSNLLFLFSLIGVVFLKVRVVFVHSYHKEYGTVSLGDPGAVYGLVQQGYLENINLEIKRYYMDTKRTNTNHEKKVKVASEIMKDMATYEYDVLATFDDNAFQYVGLNITTHPVVFTGLNGLPEMYNESFYFLDSRNRPGHNITGVYEKIFVVEAIQIMSLMVPKLKAGGNILLIADNTTTGKMISAQVKSELELATEKHIARNVSFEFLTISHFEEYKDTILNKLNNNDSIHALYYCTFSLKVGDGSTSVSSDQICEWTKANSKKPELVPGRPYCEEGLMGGLGPDYEDMGIELGLRVGQILNGIVVGDIPIGVPRHSMFVNKDRTKILDISVDPTFEGFCQYVFETPPSPPAAVEGEDPEYWNPTWVIVTLVCLMLLSGCVLCYCCYCLVTLCFVITVGEGCVGYSCINWFLLRQKQKRFDVIGKHDLNAILVEMKEAKRKSIPQIQICKKLFQIPYKDLKLKGVIGKGGQDCIVYKVKWKGKVVAYKAFRSHGFTNGNNYEEFEMEISVLGSVFHPNLLGFYGCVVENNRIGILMEYCENGDLKDYLTEQALLEIPVEIDNKIRWLTEVADGMEYLHDKSILHRDLKCKNVLLNSVLSVKIIDFGLSKMITEDHMKTKRIGTSYYMAPEIVKGHDYGTQVDVFSYGILMYEVLTGDFNPFRVKGGEMYGIELRIANDPTFRPMVDKETFPAEFYWFLELMISCWAHSPNDRPSFTIVKQLVKRNTCGRIGKEQMAQVRQSIKSVSFENHNKRETAIDNMSSEIVGDEKSFNKVVLEEEEGEGEDL